MIAVLPNSHLIGPLELVEVYEYYDGPKLFACKGLTGQLYLGLWVGSSSTGESYWLIAMSRERFLITRSGGLTLARSIASPESGFLFRCTILFLDGSTTTEKLLSENIDAALLPDPEERLALKTQTLQGRLSELELPRKAVSIQREILGLHLDFGRLTREEAPLRGLGRILISTQEILDSLGQGEYGAATMRGAIAPEILAATESRVIQAAGGSFALEISAAQSANLFGDSLIEKAINKFVNLISLGNDVEPLRAMLLEIKPRAVSKYKDLLAALVENDGAMRLEWASPVAARNRTARLDVATAAGALQTVEQVTSELGTTIADFGVFVGVEIPRKAFAAIIQGRTFRGRILAAALPKAEHITINALYFLKIRETIEVTSSGEERLKYELEEIADYAQSRDTPAETSP